MLSFSRRDFLALAAVGQISGPEWVRYADPATDLPVLRLTDPMFASGMTAPHLRQFTRHSESLLYSCERSSPGGRQAFLLDLKAGDSRQLTDAAALDPATLTFSPDERSFLYFDGQALQEVVLATGHARELHRVPDGALRTGFSVGSDGSAIFVERQNARSRLVAVLRGQARRVLETEAEIGVPMARPRRPQVLYRAEDALWLASLDGSAKRQLRLVPGMTGEAIWAPSGRTLLYLHLPEDPKELITLREHTPEDGTDRLLAKTSQFISSAPNADASVFTGASRSRGSAYVLILLRAARRELTLCEHRASDPAMVQPVFSPDSQNVFFVSDRHGKPAIYMVPVKGFVEQTEAE